MSPSPSLVVRSPRQTVSLIRNRRPHRDWDASSTSRPPSFAARDHGPKPSEVYGVVGSITTVIATAVYLAWAYTPEPVLRSLGITYYPSKYWALAVPSFVIVAVVLSMGIYMGLNFVATPPPTSFSTVFVGSARRFLLRWRRRDPSNPSLTLALIRSTILCLVINDFSLWSMSLSWSSRLETVPT